MAMEKMIKMYLKDWCLGNVMTVGVESRDFPPWWKLLKQRALGEQGRAWMGMERQQGRLDALLSGGCVEDFPPG